MRISPVGIERQGGQWNVFLVLLVLASGIGLVHHDTWCWRTRTRTRTWTVDFVSPDQAPSSATDAVSQQDELVEALGEINNLIGHGAEVVCVFLEGPDDSKASHGVPVVLRAQMALGAVFRDDEKQRDKQNGTRESRAGTPVVLDSMFAIRIVRFKINVPLPSDAVSDADASPRPHECLLHVIPTYWLGSHKSDTSQMFEPIQCTLASLCSRSRTGGGTRLQFDPGNSCWSRHEAGSGLWISQSTPTHCYWSEKGDVPYWYPNE